MDGLSDRQQRHSKYPLYDCISGRVAFGAKSGPQKYLSEKEAVRKVCQVGMNGYVTCTEINSMLCFYIYIQIGPTLEEK